MGESWSIKLLGPVEAEVDGQPRGVPGQRRKALLAVLGLNVGQTVSTDRLIDIVWGDAPPATALNTLQSHVSSLRRPRVIRAPIVARSPGYLLDVPAEASDIAVAEGLIRGAARAGNPAEAAARLQQALALWRDTALADLAGLPWFDEQAARLEEMRLDAVQSLFDIRLSLGEHESVLAELEAIVEKHPFREPLHRQLMLALYGVGRQADALAAYRRLKRTLSEELGIDPSQPLQELELAILRQDPELTIVKAPATVAPTVPAQLPPSLPGFTGRETELARLDALIAAEHESIVIAAISGTAGVGKTTLAVHWAYLAAQRFPDGQLHVDLHGFGSSGEAAHPADVLRGFLQAFGVPAERIPGGIDARESLFRTTVAHKKVLLLLDNARDAAQVRPLLPGSPGSLVVVTSRNQLQGLVVGQGAHPIHLDLLSRGEAREMLSYRLGERAQAQAVEEIIDGCARLPLALAVVAGRAATDGELSVAEVAAQLHRNTALEALATDDPATDVRAVLSSSYRVLEPDAAQVFRVLVQLPLRDVSVEVAAVLTGFEPARVRSVLAELARVNLLALDGRGRYHTHDLWRAYARELS
ncbi:MAG TPA: BTAD domain-containing putative transcriptional regulator [Candidatus Limnocylindrales bacterium]|nr:BTAD domain-containing putative transcriptional regulator [Candidatus Limnocylindrales bacterium]